MSTQVQLHSAPTQPVKVQCILNATPQYYFTTNERLFNAHCSSEREYHFQCTSNEFSLQLLLNWVLILYILVISKVCCWYLMFLWSNDHLIRTCDSVYYYSSFSTQFWYNSIFFLNRTLSCSYTSWFANVGFNGLCCSIFDDQFIVIVDLQVISFIYALLLWLCLFIMDMLHSILCWVDTHSTQIARILYTQNSSNLNELLHNKYGSKPQFLWQLFWC